MSLTFNSVASISAFRTDGFGIGPELVAHAGIEFFIGPNKDLGDHLSVEILERLLEKYVAFVNGVGFSFPSPKLGIEAL